MGETLEGLVGFAVLGAIAYAVYKADEWTPNESKIRKVLTTAIEEIEKPAVIHEIVETKEMGPFGPIDIDWRAPVISTPIFIGERLSPTRYYLITLENGRKFHGKISSTLVWVRHAAAKKL